MKPARSSFAILGFLALAGAACVAQRACAGESPRPAGTPSAVDGRLVLHVGWDGADYRRVSQLLAAGELPNLAALTGVTLSEPNGRLEGSAVSFQPLQIVEFTETKPSWATELSGLPWPVHGTFSNRNYRAVPAGWTLFEQLKAAGVPSAYVSGKCNPAKKAGHMCSGRDAQGRPFPFVNVQSAVIYFVADKNLSIAQLTGRCLEALAAVASAASGAGGYVFCHYQWPDVFGHQFGGDSPEYDQALRDLDGELPVLLGSLPPASVVLLTSDHGFEKAGDAAELQLDPQLLAGQARSKYPWGRSHLRQPRAFLASNLPLLEPATGRDLAKTIYALLGVVAPAPLPEGRSLLP